MAKGREIAMLVTMPSGTVVWVVAWRKAGFREFCGSNPEGSPFFSKFLSFFFLGLGFGLGLGLIIIVIIMPLLQLIYLTHYITVVVPKPEA